MMNINSYNLTSLKSLDYIANFVDDFNNRNLFLTAKLLKQCYRYHNIQKAYSKFYHRHSELIVKHKIGLKNSSVTRHISTYILW